MAYNFVQMRGRAAFLAAQAGAIQANPQPDWGVEINNAVSVVSWESEYNVEAGTVSTVAGMPEYPLPMPMWKYIEEAMYQPNGNIPALPLTQVNEGEIRRVDYMWQAQAVGTPTYFWVTNANKLRLYPPPGISGDVVTFRGSREAPALVNDNDMVVCPGAYHELHPLYAAINFWDTIADAGENGAGDVGKLGRMQKKYDNLLQKLTDWINDDNAAMQRTVVGRSPDRVPLGIYAFRRRGG